MSWHTLRPCKHLADSTSHQQCGTQCSVIAQTPANLSQTVLKTCPAYFMTTPTSPDPTTHQQSRMQCSVIAQTPANLSQTVLNVVELGLLINSSVSKLIEERQLIEGPRESVQ
ncbi:hypothetical protein CEXT_690231 [Caerostris extrusa]|uniref:Uncharacterized protein n=1 Tax=Caerostris extrusa TaxID=172846 RepID=A0AAV4WZJ0_CAEEX|nr:hypothetical protein CEXT_690231 [Caerostris extrusa]